MGYILLATTIIRPFNKESLGFNCRCERSEDKMITYNPFSARVAARKVQKRDKRVLLLTFWCIIVYVLCNVCTTCLLSKLNMYIGGNTWAILHGWIEAFWIDRVTPPFIFFFFPKVSMKGFLMVVFLWVNGVSDWYSKNANWICEHRQFNNNHNSWW